MADQQKYDQAIIDLVEMNKMLREDLREHRRIDNELIVVLGDLRGELEHLRTQRERDDRFRHLAESARAESARAESTRAKARTKTKAPKKSSRRKRLAMGAV